jgi:nucleoside phosphorylase
VPDDNSNANIHSPVAVTFALPEESRDFVAGLGKVAVLQGGALPVIAEPGPASRRILVCHTGVGMESCKARIIPFLDEHRPHMLISSGFAGGLDPSLKVGDLIIATNYSSSVMLTFAAQRTQAARVTMTTQRAVAATPAGKATLFSETGASAVDMETAFIFEQCQQRGIEVLALRGISDAAGDELPIPFPVWFDNIKQKPRVAALLRHLAAHPSKIPRFVRFVRGVSLTRKRLTKALVAFIGRR